MNAHISSQHNAHTIALASLRQRITKWLIVLFVLLFATYAYIMGNITFNTAARNALSMEHSLLASQVGEMEVEYLRLADTITLGSAKARGFQESKNVFYIKKNASVSSAYLSGHEL